MQASPSALRAHATHLELVSKNSRSHAGHGWTYDDEVELMRAAADELQSLREIAKRLADLRNSTGRVDLTDSSKRAEIYALVCCAEDVLKMRR